MITPQQNKILHALLAQTNLTTNKAALVSSYSSGRTESSRELSNFEANELISYLRTQIAKLRTTGLDRKADKMRKKILSLAYQMNWVTEQGKVDMKRINAWCIKYGYLRKPLNNYLYAELPRLLTQFENMYYSYLKTI